MSGPPGCIRIRPGQAVLAFAKRVIKFVLRTTSPSSDSFASDCATLASLREVTRLTPPILTVVPLQIPCRSAGSYRPAWGRGPVYHIKESPINRLSRHKNQCAHWYLFHGPIDKGFFMRSMMTKQSDAALC